MFSEFQSDPRRGETVDLLRLAPEDACANEMVAIVRWQNRSLAVLLSHLIEVDADEATTRSHQRLALLTGTWLLVLIRPAPPSSLRSLAERTRSTRKRRVPTNRHGEF